MSLTRENIKQHCRTCLNKLKFEDIVSLQKVGSDDEITESKEFCINLANNEEIKHIIATYMTEGWTSEVTEAILEDYPQYICIYCYNKLQAYELFRKQIKQSDQKLQEVLRYGINKIEIGEDGENLNMEENAKTIPTQDTTNIFKLLVKDALMETETIMLDTSNVSTTVNHETAEPDPFDVAIPSKFEDSISENGSLSINEYNSEVWQNCQEDVGVTENEEVLLTTGYHDNRVLNKKIIYEIFDANDSSQRDYKKDGDLEIIKLRTRNRKKLLTEGKPMRMENSNGSKKNEDAHSRQIQIQVDAQHVDSKMKRRNKGTKNSFKCNQCGHCFAHKITLDAHIRKVHEGSKRPFKCDRCEKTYAFIGGLYTHIKEIHDAAVRSYACNIPGCDRVYTSFIAMQKHKRVNHSESPCVKKYVCEQCGATFNQSGNLKYHRRSKHPTDAEQAEKDELKERFECDICKKLFHSRYTLKYHTLQFHTNEMKYECNVCGRRMAKKFMLVQHMLVHSTNKMPCEHCGRQFIRKFELEAHVRAVHMKLKPFECQYCSECFASRKTLRHHEYIHTGEKPYVCDICGQAYRQQTCLKNHRRSHEKFNGDNVFTTNICRTNSYFTAPVPTIVQCSKTIPFPSAMSGEL